MQWTGCIHKWTLWPFGAYLWLLLLKGWGLEVRGQRGEWRGFSYPGIYKTAHRQKLQTSMDSIQLLFNITSKIKGALLKKCSNRCLLFQVLNILCLTNKGGLARRRESFLIFGQEIFQKYILRFFLVLNSRTQLLHQFNLFYRFLQLLHFKCTISDFIN